MESEATHSAFFYQLYAWFDAHKKQVAWAIGLLLAVGLVIGFVCWRSRATQENANYALSQVISRGWAASQPEAPANFLKVAADYPGSAAAGRALLMAASGFFREGKFSEAEAQCRKYLSEFRGGPFAAQASFG